MMSSADDQRSGPVARAMSLDQPVITLPAKGRNVLREEVLECLEVACSDLWIVAETDDAVATRTLAREVGDDLLLLDEIEWERDADHEVSVALPKDLLRAALSRHCHRAFLRKGKDLPQEIAARWDSERNQLLISTLTRALAELDQ